MREGVKAAVLGELATFSSRGGGGGYISYHPSV